MTSTSLKRLFHPRSVALIGASPDPQKMGSSVMKNLLSGGFNGPLLPVNPKYSSVHGVLCYKSVSDLPLPPDLAIICTPSETVPRVIERLSFGGTKMAVVLSADPEGGRPGTALKKSILEAAAPDMRILGPGSIGVLIPGMGLNGTWAKAGFKAGRVALISQSGAVAQSVMHWGENHDVGFSHVLSTGDSINIDMGELVDHLAEEPTSRAILLYVQQLTGARRFLSAVRAAAKLKPVIVIRSGRRNRNVFDVSPDGLPTVPVDHIFEAAFSRAGLLRVLDLDELLDAVENLAHGKPLLGEKLLIVSNGAGTAETAADAYVLGGGVMARLGAEATAQLRKIIPSRCAIDNPLDIGRDAGPERYREVLKVLTTAEGIDALLVMHTPTSVSPEREVAQEVAETTRHTMRNVLSCWLGGDMKGKAHALCEKAGIPVFSTPDKAARAFLHMVRYRRTQELLLETPSPPPPGTERRLEKAGELIKKAKICGATMLDEESSGKLLNAYGIETEPLCVVESERETLLCAAKLGFPVALKLRSPTMVRSQALGSVVLGLSTVESVAQAAAMLKDGHLANCPGEPFPGFVLQRRVWKPNAMLYSAGISVDPVFGPVIFLGHGGAAGKISSELTVGLPPLNMKLAEELAGGLKALEQAQLDEATRKAMKRNLSAFLVRISQMLEDVPELLAMEINPLLVDTDGVLAADARFTLTGLPRADFAIRPYPRELEENLALKDGGALLIRPVRAEDEDDYRTFLSRMSDEDLRRRFFTVAKNMPKAQINNMTSIDFEREMAFVAVTPDSYPQEILGIVHIKQTIDNSEAEYAIIIRSDLKAKGLGRLLMEKIIRYARSRGIGALTGYVLKSNFGMLGLCFKLGFSAISVEDDDIMAVRLDLTRKQQ